MMPGTRTGGLCAAKKNLSNNPNFYAEIGAIGGRNGHTGGFAIDVYCNCGDIEKLHYKRQCAGKRGGTVSRRRPKNAVKER